ncbi:MAG: MFS transporter [Pseudonocardiales bacterium]|nr:MAG: MFS transporter [Pseudonocardiales bacterium]
MTTTEPRPTEPRATAPRVDAPPERADTLWHNTDFVRFWAGEGLSMFGSQVTNMALPLTAVIVFDASSEQVGLLRFAQMVPYLFLALAFGVWVDRGRRKPVMMLANGARLVLIASVPVLSHYHLLSIDELLLIAGVIGIFSVLFDVSWMSYVPTLVRSSRHYVDANQKLGVTQSTTDVAGPGAAGVLIGWLGPTTALLLDAVSYLASLTSLVSIRTVEPPAPPVERRSFGRELVEGVRWVFGHRVLRPLAMLAPFTNFSLTCISTLFLLYGLRAHHLSPAAIGLVFSASSIGALLGALLSKRLMRRCPVGPLYGCALACLYAAPLLIPLAGGPRPLIIALFILSLVLSYFGSGLSNVIQLSLRQTCTPTSMMGRMSAAFRTLLFGGGALGGLCAGLLGGALGLHAALVLVTVCSAAMLVPIALSPVVRLRAMPVPVDDVSPAVPAAPHTDTDPVIDPLTDKVAQS